MNIEAKRFPSYQSVIILLTLGFSVTALLLSYSAQYIWGIEPCRLCKLQRIPYFFILVFSGLAIWPNLKKVAIKLIQASFFVSLILACYHLFVLGGIINNPCSVPTSIATIEDFQNMLNAPPPCSRANWTLFRIPLPRYILIFAFVFSYFLFRSHRNSNV